MEILNIFQFILILQPSFQEILYGIGNWINEGSGWIVESVDNQYINISNYGPLLGTTYINLY